MQRTGVVVVIPILSGLHHHYVRICFSQGTGAKDEVLLTATAQNLRRLAKLLCAAPRANCEPLRRSATAIMPRVFRPRVFTGPRAHRHLKSSLKCCSMRWLAGGALGHCA